MFFRVELEENNFNTNNVTITLTKANDTLINQLLSWSFSRQTFVTVFVFLTISMIIVTLIRSIIFVLVCMKSSITLHNKMFNAITNATMRFFNTNSSGKNNYIYIIAIKFMLIYLILIFVYIYRADSKQIFKRHWCN